MIRTSGRFVLIMFIGKIGNWLEAIGNG